MDPLHIQDDIQVAAIPGAGVSDFLRCIFLAAERTTITEKFIHFSVFSIRNFTVLEQDSRWLTALLVNLPQLQACKSDLLSMRDFNLRQKTEMIGWIEPRICGRRLVQDHPAIHHAQLWINKDIIQRPAPVLLEVLGAQEQ